MEIEKGERRIGDLTVVTQPEDRRIILPGEKTIVRMQSGGGTGLVAMGPLPNAGLVLESNGSPITKRNAIGNYLALQAGDPIAEILARYKIDPNRLPILGPGDVPVDPSTLPADRREIVGRALLAYEHALKNKLLGNVSGRQFGASLLMKNGTWGVATNIENSRDIGVLCGERSAIVTAWNSALGGMSLEALADPAVAKRENAGLAVEMLVMATAKGIAGCPGPCAECQSWLATNRYISPATRIAALEETPQGLAIRMRKVSDLLPLHTSGTVPSPPTMPVGDLPIVFSERAKVAMNDRLVNEKQLRQAMEKAIEAQNKNTTAEFSHRLGGAATLFTSGNIYTGARFDWTARWFEEADLGSAARGVQILKIKRVAAQISAVAYCGDEWPSVRSLGVIAQPTRGGPDTLILTVENNRIQVRTVRDYMTDIYLTSTAVQLMKAAEEAAKGTVVP